MSHPGFFTVGTGRCGSTLVRKLLRHHPSVHVPKETHWIPILHDRFGHKALSAREFLQAAGSVYMAKGKTALARILKEEGLGERELRKGFGETERQTAAGWMATFYHTLAARNDAVVWGDKTPDYGYCMGLLADLFPGARFLHVARDGRDVALSMSSVLSFRYQVAWGVNYWPHIAWEKAYEARESIAEAPLADDRFYDLWRSRLLRTRDEATRLEKDSYLEIRYEDLLRDPRPILQRVHDHLRFPGGTEWVATASAMIRSDNLGRNRTDSRWRALTESHSADLAQLGFDPAP